MPLGSHRGGPSPRLPRSRPPSPSLGAPAEGGRGAQRRRWRGTAAGSSRSRATSSSGGRTRSTTAAVAESGVQRRQGRAGAADASAASAEEPAASPGPSPPPSGFDPDRSTGPFGVPRLHGPARLRRTLLPPASAAARPCGWRSPCPYPRPPTTRRRPHQCRRSRRRTCCSWRRGMWSTTATITSPSTGRAGSDAAIKKMLATLDDPFTRLLEPEKFKSSRSGTQGALMGVGLSIGYPLAPNGSTTRLSVMSAAPRGPAEKAGIVSGDVILAIDDASAQDIWVLRSSVDLTILSGADTRHFVLKRERYTLNPVMSRMCEIPGSEDSSEIGYIKLTTFNQNAAGSVKEAIKKLRENNVKPFVLDLRNNSGGLFPEGIEIAKIW
ncbi:hypothetical protein CFC21_042570 [Triticum aestivum]|uniref:PDZ domain-containing protein n=2 Tax=Triticum aestivum TaxID=4565 RepID=A0A9R1FMQ5_WHEAT|nr:hypothetical protein CFC21_042570 [Triticum aestivum]